MITCDGLLYAHLCRNIGQWITRYRIPSSRCWSRSLVLSAQTSSSICRTLCHTYWECSYMTPLPVEQPSQRSGSTLHTHTHTIPAPQYQLHFSGRSLLEFSFGPSRGRLKKNNVCICCVFLLVGWRLMKTSATYPQWFYARTRWLFCVEWPQYSIQLEKRTFTSFTICCRLGMSPFWLSPFSSVAVLTIFWRHQTTPTWTVSVMIWRVVSLRRRTEVGEVSCKEYAGQRNNFELIPMVKWKLHIL